MIDKWKERLENLGVIGVALALFILTMILVFVGVDWMEGL